jgi:hypothetical protein
MILFKWETVRGMAWLWYCVSVIESTLLLQMVWDKVGWNYFQGEGQRRGRLRGRIGSCPEIQAWEWFPGPYLRVILISPTNYIYQDLWKDLGSLLTRRSWWNLTRSYNVAIVCLNTILLYPCLPLYCIFGLEKKSLAHNQSFLHSAVNTKVSSILNTPLDRRSEKQRKDLERLISAAMRICPHNAEIWVWPGFREQVHRIWVDVGVFKSYSTWKSQ